MAVIELKESLKYLELAGPSQGVQADKGGCWRWGFLDTAAMRGMDLRGGRKVLDTELVAEVNGSGEFRSSSQESCPWELDVAIAPLSANQEMDVYG